MEPESSSPYPQVSATRPYPEPTPSSPHDPSNFLRSILILSSHLRLGLLNGVFPSGFPINTLCTHTPLSSPIRATCPAHLIRLDFTTRTISIKVWYYNLIGPPSYMRSVLDQNVVMRRMTVHVPSSIPGYWKVFSPTRKETSYSDQTLSFASHWKKIQKSVRPTRPPRH